MKIKLFIVVIIVIVLGIGLGICCGTAAQYNRKNVYGRYILISKLGNGIEGYSRLVYDKDTYVMYVFNDEDAMSPYYIVKNNKAEIAIYNVNWFGVDSYE